MKHAWLAILVAAVGCSKSGSVGDRIVAYSRENNSGTYMYFKEHVLENADFGTEIQTLPGTAAVIHAVSQDRNAIGYGGIGYVKGVRVLAVKKDAATASVEPTLESVVQGSYPISRGLYFYTAGPPTGATLDFLCWVLQEQGQKICAEVGYYPVPERERPPLVPPPALAAGERQTVTVKGSDTMVILGQRWAERYMNARPDVLVQITGGGSGTGFAALINGSTDICQASRPIKPKEREQVKEKHGKEVAEFRVALDGLAIFVHESNPLREISLPELKAIFTGQTPSWGELRGSAK
jgi:ABC-type phosphate transport system substrate-binding protein